jgi:hypothetical protein
VNPIHFHQFRPAIRTPPVVPVVRILFILVSQKIIARDSRRLSSFPDRSTAVALLCSIHTLP